LVSQDLAESGALGFTAFVFFLATLFVYLIWGYRRLGPGEARVLVLGVLACLSGFSLQGYGSDVWDFYMLKSIYWILIAMAVNVTDAGTRSDRRAHTGLVNPAAVASVLGTPNAKGDSTGVRRYDVV